MAESFIHRLMAIRQSSKNKCTQQAFTRQQRTYPLERLSGVTEEMLPAEFHLPGTIQSSYLKHKINQRGSEYLNGAQNLMLGSIWDTSHTVPDQWH